MSEDLDYIVLYDEDGNESEFEVIATLEVDENEYAVLLPTDINYSFDSDEASEVYILRMEQDENNEDILVGIEDEEELNFVISAYEELIKDESN